jgi:hypothetical protein
VWRPTHGTVAGERSSLPASSPAMMRSAYRVAKHTDRVGRALRNLLRLLTAGIGTREKRTAMQRPRQLTEVFLPYRRGDRYTCSQSCHSVRRDMPQKAHSQSRHFPRLAMCSVQQEAIWRFSSRSSRSPL